jgi:predicted PurR-regulated permease PerM
MGRDVRSGFPCFNCASRKAHDALMSSGNRSKGGEAAPAGLARRALVVSSIAIGCTLAALLLWYSLRVLLLLFAGVLVAILLRALADGVSQVTRLRHGWSLAIVMVVLTASFGLVGWLTVPSLLDELGQVGEQLSTSMSRLHESVSHTRLGAAILQYLPDNAAFAAWRDQILGHVGSLFSTALAGAVTILVVAFIGLYVAAEPDMYIRGMLRVFPHDVRDRVSEVAGSIGYTLKWWLIGQAVDMVVIGVATWLGLWMLGIPSAALIGVLAALVNFIPNFGPLIALVPAALLALSISPSMVLWVVVLFIVLHSLEGYILLPLIQRRAVNLPAAIIIAAQVLLGLLAGGLGLALATPLAAATFVAVKMLYVEDMLGDYIDTPEHHEAREEVQKVKQAKRQVDRSAAKPVERS